jgi:hypothetical protein
VVRPEAGGGVSWSHTGALEGTCAAWLIRTPDGLAFGFVTNTLPSDIPGFFTDLFQLVDIARDAAGPSARGANAPVQVPAAAMEGE